MPRVKPTKKIDVLGNLDLRPEQAVADYFISKHQEKFFVKPPNADSAGDSIELLYIHNNREHNLMVKLQKEMLTNAQRQSEMNMARVRKMYKVQDRLRKRFVEVNSFIKDCVEKKRLAEKTINEESSLHVELTEGIAKFKTSIAELTAFREALKATVEEFQPYEKVLDEVVQVSDIYVSPKDCMDRCDALMLAQVEISELESKKLDEIENMRQRMVKLTNEAALTVLGLKNDLSKLERSYNQSRQMCLKWEKILESTKDTITTNLMEKNRTIDAIYTLYRTLCRRREITPHLSYNDIEAQLDFIKIEVELLNAILKENEEQNAAKTLEKTGGTATGEGAYC